MAGSNKIKEREEVGVIPMPSNKSDRTWWLAFGFCCLMTFWTRLHKVGYVTTMYVLSRKSEAILYDD